MTRTIGAMVIKRQAAIINRQLLQLQQRQQVQEDDQTTSNPGQNKVEESRPWKRQRMDDRCADSRLHEENQNEPSIVRSLERCVRTTRTSQEATLQAAAIQASPNSHCSSSDDTSPNHGSLLNSGATDSNVSTASRARNTSTTCRYSTILCPDDDATRIWYQVDRMKRMSIYLKNAQIAQSLLLEEMRDCYCTNIHEGGAETHDREESSDQQSEVNLDDVSHKEV